jgi:hypothetical protein
MFGVYIGFRGVSRTGGGERHQGDAKSGTNEAGHGEMSSSEGLYSVNDAIEANGVRNAEAVMPPLLVVVQKSLRLHEALEP